jgi:hypothetical protein
MEKNEEEEFLTSKAHEGAEGRQNKERNNFFLSFARLIRLYVCN